MLNINEIKEKLTEVLFENGVELNGSGKIDVDSLTFVSVVIAIEEAFGVTIPDEAFFDNIQDINILSKVLLDQIEPRENK